MKPAKQLKLSAVTRRPCGEAVLEGVARDQGWLFPTHLEDFLDEDNPVRAVDAFADKQRALGFEALDPSPTGRPARRQEGI